MIENKDKNFKILEKLKPESVISVEGDVVKRSKETENKELKGYIGSYFNRKESLKVKFNNKFDKSIDIEILSRGINLRNFNYKIFDKELKVIKGTFKSKFKYYKSAKNTFCRGCLLYTSPSPRD